MKTMWWLCGDGGYARHAHLQSTTIIYKSALIPIKNEFLKALNKLLFTKKVIF